MNFLSQIPFLGLISHDHFQQYESQVEKSLNDIGNKNQDIHEWVVTMYQVCTEVHSGLKNNLGVQNIY